MRTNPILASLALAVTTFTAGPARAEIVTKTVEYKQGDQVFEGFLAYDTAGPARKPGVLVVHEWNGINPHTRAAAEKLASWGYVAFAPDIYGKGIRPATPDLAKAESSKYGGNRPLLRARVQLGLDELRKLPNVDPAKVAAIGFCFGGMTVLELARSGADVKGVATFHGILATPTPADAKNIKAKVLVLHGADDPFVPDAQVKAFEEEMRGGKVDWVLVSYGNAVHAFTNPAHGTDRTKPLAYDATVDRRAWEALKAFLGEWFGA
jgi:dienelactone hydrolase